MVAKFNKPMALLVVALFVFICATVATETQWLNIVKNRYMYGTFMTTSRHPDSTNFNPIPTADANFNCLFEGGFMAYNKKPVWDVNPIAGFWSNVTQNTAVAVATQIQTCFARNAKMYNTKIYALNARQIANSCAMSIPDHHNPLNAEPLCLLDGKNFQDISYDGLWDGWNEWNSARYCVCLDNIWPRGTGDQRVQGWVPGDCNYECSGKSYSPTMFPNGGIQPYSWTFRNGCPSADGSVIDLRLFDLGNYANFFANTALMVQFNPANCPAMHSWVPGMAPLNPSNCQKGLPSVVPPTAGSPVHYFGMITGMTYNAGQYHFTMCTPTNKKYKIQLNAGTAQLEYVEDGNMSTAAQPDASGIPSMGGRPACWNFVVGSVDYAPKSGGGDVVKSANWPLFENMAYYFSLYTELGGMMHICPADPMELSWLEPDNWPMSAASASTMLKSTLAATTTTVDVEDAVDVATAAKTAKLTKEETPEEEDKRKYMTQVINATIATLFDDSIKAERLALQNVQVTKPTGGQKPTDVVTLEDAQLIENQVKIPRAVLNKVFGINAKQTLPNVTAQSIRVAVAMYISIHAEKKWNVGLTAEQKDAAIHAIFTAGQGASKGTSRKSDLKLLNCQAVKSYQVYKLSNVGKTFQQIKDEQKAQRPIPERQQECAAARAQFELECNKIPNADKPEADWEWNTPEVAIACLSNTTSPNFKKVETLCNAKNVYPKIEKENAATKKTVRDEL